MSERVEIPKEAVDFIKSWENANDAHFVNEIRWARRAHWDWFAWTEFAVALRTELDMRLLLRLK